MECQYIYIITYIGKICIVQYYQLLDMILVRQCFRCNHNHIRYSMGFLQFFGLWRSPSPWPGQLRRQRLGLCLSVTADLRQLVSHAAVCRTRSRCAKYPGDPTLLGSSCGGLNLGGRTQYVLGTEYFKLGCKWLTWESFDSTLNIISTSYLSSSVLDMMMFTLFLSRWQFTCHVASFPSMTLVHWQEVHIH